MINLTDENFEKEITNSSKPILVDFWAQWCTPCFVLGPILEKVVQGYKDKLTLAKVDLDTAPQISQKYEIEQIPTVILFKNGKPVSEFIGVKPESAIKKILDEALKNNLKTKNLEDSE